MNSALCLPSESSLQKLKPAERVFVTELIADDLWSPTRAAKRAGYKNPDVEASRLMKKARIQEMLGREQRRRLERTRLRADEVLSMLAQALFFNPLSLFKPTKNGAWAIEDLDKIPDHIGRCISKMKTKTIPLDDGKEITYFEIEFMDKTKLLDLAMKHCGVSGIERVHLESHEGTPSNVLSQALANLEQSRQVVDANTIEVTVNAQAEAS